MVAPTTPMTYGAKLNIALGVALGAMLLVAWLMQRDAEHLQPMLSEFDYAAVSTLRIEVANREPVSFERVDGAWRMRLPLEIEVDARRIEEVVNALAVPSAARYPARDLGLDALGLGDPPRARVVVDGEPFLLGDTNPVTRQRYVRRGEVVHLVTDLLYFRLLGEPHGWVRRQPLPPGSRISRIEAGGFVIGRTDDGWALEWPVGQEASAATLRRVVDAWANAQAYEVRRWEGPMPFENVALIWLDGSDEPLEFILRRWDDRMAVIRPDLELEFLLPLYRAEDLWNLPQDAED
jgi:hypothetical protein